MKNTYRILLTFLVPACAAMIFAACGRTVGVEAVNKTADGLAIRGYDTVAFFNEQIPVHGNPEISYNWNGATWLFSTPENMLKFKEDPAAFAPQYGGFCSYAVSHGYTADGDPLTWKIVDGKLFLNYNEEAKQAWEKQQDEFIREGEKNWAEFQKKKPEHKG